MATRRRKKKPVVGNYRVLRQIGEGAFGRTYEAEHIHLGTKACLKQNMHIDKVDINAFKQEAAVLWGIHHYSLPTLRDFIECPDGSFAIVMTYVEGPTLEDIVDKHKVKKKNLHPEHACWMTQRLLNALHYLHYHGIIHGDIKPANIIIEPEEHNAILIDYGFAVINPHRYTTAEGYTPAFAPPELVAGKPPLPESDLYALGATMIYAMGGNPIAKTYPSRTPRPVKDFFDELVLHDPLKRPNWETGDLVKKLSDVREKVFKRRRSSRKLEF